MAAHQEGRPRLIRLALAGAPGERTEARRGRDQPVGAGPRRASRETGARFLSGNEPRRRGRFGRSES